MDCKDGGSVSPEQSPQGKRQPVIEVCNFSDAGTSIALWAQARDDFHEQTALETVITCLRQYGCPRQMTFDRDPRWVGSVSGRDFPAPLRRLLLCLGITPPICLPHRPDKTADVERFHRTYGSDCSLLLITRSPFLTPLSACSRSISSVSMPSPKHPLFCGSFSPQKEGLFSSSFLSSVVLPLSSTKKAKVVSYQPA